MIEYKISDVIKRLSLIITISMAIVGTMLASEIMISKEEISKTNVEESIETAKIDTNLQEKKATSVKTTSRGSSEIRNSAKSSTNKSTTEQVNQNSEQNTKKSTDSNKTAEEQENKKNTTKTVSISEVKISKSMDLTKRTGLSKEDFIKLMSRVKADTSGFFEDNAEEIYDLCEKYSINEIFFCGLISAESGWNIASNHRNTHNYISLMKNGKLIKYSSISEGLEVAAKKLHYNYLTPGGKFYNGKTLAGVKKCFCPSSTWVDLVYGRMKQIV